ncbi:hypothetical protein B0H21DRAFT_735766, partial [Amylocystis lapponica]
QLSHDVKDTRTQLNDRIDSLQQNVDNRFDSLQQYVDNSFDSLQRYVDNRVNLLDRDVNNLMMTNSAHTVSEVTKVVHEAIDRANVLHTSRWNELRQEINHWSEHLVHYSREMMSKKSCE